MSLADQQWCPTSVQVTVLQARGLRTKGKSGTNDAYAVMQVGKEKYQTSVVEKSVAPVWKEEAAFDLPQLQQGGGGGGGGTERSTLHVNVLHRALVGPDKLLGQAVINLQQLSEDRTRNKTEWFKLLDKAGKADKDRGEVFVDIQFMRNNMTTSMFDLSAAGKSRSRLGKFKDKVRGKKKDSDAASTTSTMVPSFTQVLTDSEEEGHGEGEVAAGKDDKKKKHKMKSLFSPKSNLQRNMSQSMSVLPAKNSSLSSSQSSGLNVDSSEGKKKFKFMIHKRSGSSDSKDSSGHQKHGAAEQSNLCINGSHVYCEEPQPRSSRIGSNFSLASSGHGSMEDVPESSPPSVDSLRAVRQYSPWTEEEEEMAEVENIKKDVGELREEDEERIRIEEERRRKEEEEVMLRKQEEEVERLAEKRKERMRIEEEEKRQSEEEERIRMEEERRRKEEEEVMLRKQEEEVERLAEEKRKERMRIEEEEKRQREEEERIRMEEERAQEERRRQEEEERRRTEEEKVRKEEEERIRREEKERAQEERRRQEEEERARREEERERLAEEKQRLEEQERRRIEEEKRQKEEEERIRMEKERAQEDRRRQEEEERARRQEEKLKLAEEKRRLEEEETRRIEEEKVRKEEERIRGEQEWAQEERRRQEEEEMVRRQEEEHEQKRLEEQERRQKKEEDRIKKEEEERARRQKEEYERLVEEKQKLEEEERKRIEAEEKIRKEEEERLRVEEEEEENVRRQEEEREKLAEEKRKLEEQDRRRIEEEKRQKEEEERVGKEERRREEEERARKEKEEYERLVEEKMREEEQERRRIEEERIGQEEQERIKMEEERRKRQEEKQRVFKEEEKIKREEEERIGREEKVEKEARKLETRNAEEQKKMENKTKHEAAGIKPKAESPAEVTSSNPFDENYSNNPFEESPSSPLGPDSSTAKVSTVKHRSQSDVSLLGSQTTCTGEKDLISTQREKRVAPRPPGRNQAQRQREDEGSARHPAQINKQNKDVKTVSILPQRSVQVIAPLSRSPTDAKNTQCLTQSNTTKGTINVAKHSKRPAPPRPGSVEEGPSSEPKTASSSDDKISKEFELGAKQEPIAYGLNPFEDDEDENVLTAQDDTTTNTGSAQWPAAVSQAADKNAPSHAKIKSSKMAHAPPLPAKKAATSSTLISQSTEGVQTTDNTGVAVPENSVTHPCDPEHVQETPLEESQPATVKSAGAEAAGKKEGPPTTSRKLQPVKPLNPLGQQSVAIVQGETDNKSCEVQEKTKVNSTGGKGPYSLLTREELISLVLKQENQLSQRDVKISELEQYIDNLLVRVIEEKPSILMSLNSLKKPV